MENGLGLYGFTKPGENSLLPSIRHYLSIPVDSLTGDDRNIAFLARIYNGLDAEFIEAE